MASGFEQFMLKQRWFSKDYTEQLIGLLPKGFAWTFDRYSLGTILQDVISGDKLQDVASGATPLQDVVEISSSGNLLRRLLSCFASEFERAEAAAWKLINESDPGVATDLLEDWERVLGLPESCVASQAFTLEERQRQAHAKLFDTFKTANEKFYIDFARTLGFEISINQIPVDITPRIMGVARMGVERMGGRGGFSTLEITILSGSSDSTMLKCSFNKVKPAHVLITWLP